MKMEKYFSYNSNKVFKVKVKLDLIKKMKIWICLETKVLKKKRWKILLSKSKRKKWRSRKINLIQMNNGKMNKSNKFN